MAAVRVVGTDPVHILKSSCGNCASSLEYVAADINEERHTDYGGGTDICKFIVCPACRKKVWTS